MSARSTVDRLLAQHPRSFVEEAGVPSSPSTPRALFQLLCAAMLFGARIRIDIAQRSARAVKAAGWTTPRRLLGASDSERIAVLSASGYGRYADVKAAQLASAARAVASEYGGDLRTLRDVAGRDPEAERQRLLSFAGIGPLAADVFLRQAQTAWEEVYPYVDARASDALAEARLPRTARGIARYVDAPEDLPRVIDAAIRQQRRARSPADA